MEKKINLKNFKKVSKSMQNYLAPGLKILIKFPLTFCNLSLDPEQKIT